MKGKVIGIEGNEVGGNRGRVGIVGKGGTLTPIGGKGGNLVGLGKVGMVGIYAELVLSKILRAPRLKFMLDKATTRSKYVNNNFLEAMVWLMKNLEL
ncbi:hypothetical protein Lal_00041113 [Lupinus albus]|nr:hypothetical protein Lal_00041113 [Lupinus albus]